jgi:hypothetical protein
MIPTFLPSVRGGVARASWAAITALRSGRCQGSRTIRTSNWLTCISASGLYSCSCKCKDGTTDHQNVTTARWPTKRHSSTAAPHWTAKLKRCAMVSGPAPFTGEPAGKRVDRWGWRFLPSMPGPVATCRYSSGGLPQDRKRAVSSPICMEGYNTDASRDAR